MSYTTVFNVREGSFQEVIAFATSEEAHEYGMRLVCSNGYVKGFDVVEIHNPVSHIFFRSHLYERKDIRCTPGYLALMVRLRNNRIATNIEYPGIFRIHISFNMQSLNQHINIHSDHRYMEFDLAVFQFMNDFCLYLDSDLAIKRFLNELVQYGLIAGDMP